MATHYYNMNSMFVPPTITTMKWLQESQLILMKSLFFNSRYSNTHGVWMEKFALLTGDDIYQYKYIWMLTQTIQDALLLLWRDLPSLVDILVWYLLYFTVCHYFCSFWWKWYYINILPSNQFLLNGMNRPISWSIVYGYMNYFIVVLCSLNSRKK